MSVFSYLGMALIYSQLSYSRRDNNPPPFTTALNIRAIYHIVQEEHSDLTAPKIVAVY